MCAADDDSKQIWVKYDFLIVFNSLHSFALLPTVTKTFPQTKLYLIRNPTQLALQVSSNKIKVYQKNCKQNKHVWENVCMRVGSMFKSKTPDVLLSTELTTDF